MQPTDSFLDDCARVIAAITGFALDRCTTFVMDFADGFHSGSANANPHQTVRQVGVSVFVDWVNTGARHDPRSIVGTTVEIALAIAERVVAESAHRADDLADAARQAFVALQARRHHAQD